MLVGQMDANRILERNLCKCLAVNPGTGTRLERVSKKFRAFSSLQESHIGLLSCVFQKKM